MPEHTVPDADERPLPAATRVLVGDPIYGDGHETTWEAFCADNGDGFSPAELDEIGAAIGHGATYEGGGGAEGIWWIRRVS